MTERKSLESDRAELVALADELASLVTFQLGQFSTVPGVALNERNRDLIVTALRLLAAQDQKPQPIGYISPATERMLADANGSGAVVAAAGYDTTIPLYLSHQPAPVAANVSAEAAERIGSWLAAALEDPNVCAEMKADIKAWFDAGQPLYASAEARLREALEAISKLETNSEWRCVKIAKDALSVHPHASDCDKRENKSDDLCHCSWGCVEADNCRRKAVAVVGDGVGRDGETDYDSDSRP